MTTSFYQQVDVHHPGSEVTWYFFGWDTDFLWSNSHWKSFNETKLQIPESKTIKSTNTHQTLIYQFKPIRILEEILPSGDGPLWILMWLLFCYYELSEHRVENWKKVFLSLFESLTRQNLGSRFIIVMCWHRQLNLIRV